MWGIGDIHRQPKHDNPVSQEMKGYLHRAINIFTPIVQLCYKFGAHI